MTAVVARIESAFQLLALQEAVVAGYVPVPDRILVRSSAGRTGLTELLDPAIQRAIAPHERSALGVVTDPGAHLVIGDPFSRRSQLAMLFGRPRGVTLLDDGASSLHLAALIDSDGPAALTRAHNTKASARALGELTRRRLDQLAMAGGVDVVIGTPIGDDAVRAMGRLGYRVRSHGFTWLRHLDLSDRAPDWSGTGVVVGSALAADGFIEPHHYVAWLREHCAPGTLFVPHRRERPLERVLAEARGAEISITSLPVELVLRAAGRAVDVACLPSTPALTVPLCAAAGSTVSCSPIPRTVWEPRTPPGLVAMTDRIVELAGAVRRATAPP